MANNQVDIRFQTTADTSGAKQASDAVKKVEKSSEDAAEAIKKIDSAADKAAESVEKVDSAATKADANRRKGVSTLQQLEKAESDLAKTAQGSVQPQQELAESSEDLARAAKELRKESERAGGIRTREGRQISDLAGRTDRAAKSTRDLAQQQNNVSKSGKNSGRAVLEASRAIEDLQFGVVGVLNNLPGLVQSLGGGAGLAGVISLVAVGLFQIVPQIARMGKEVKLTAEELKELASRTADQAKAQQQLADEKFLESLADQTAAYVARAAVQDRSIELAQAEREAAEALIDTRLELNRIAVEAQRLTNPDFDESDAARARSDQEKAAAARALESALDSQLVKLRQIDRAEAERLEKLQIQELELIKLNKELERQEEAIKSNQLARLNELSNSSAQQEREDVVFRRGDNRNLGENQRAARIAELDKQIEAERVEFANLSATVEALSDALEKRRQEVDRQATAFDRATDAANSAAETEDQIRREILTAVEGIRANASEQGVVVELKSLTEILKAEQSETKSALSDVRASLPTEGQGNAELLRQITAALQDGIVTADEQTQTSQAIQSFIQANRDLQPQTLQLLQVLQTEIQDQARVQAELQNLSANFVTTTALTNQAIQKDKQDIEALQRQIQQLARQNR